MSERARVWMGWVSLVALPSALVADTAVAWLQGWTPPPDVTSQAIYRFGSNLVVAFLAVPSLCLLWKSGRLFLARIGPGLLLGFFTFWIFLEIVLDRLGWDARNFHRGFPNESRILRPTADLLPGVEGEARRTMNRQGIRGPEFPRREAGSSCSLA